MNDKIFNQDINDILSKSENLNDKLVNQNIKGTSSTFIIENHNDKKSSNNDFIKKDGADDSGLSREEHEVKKMFSWEMNTTI